MANAPRTTYPGISPNAWEHPADRVALNALRQIPGFDQLLRFVIGGTWEQIARLYFLGSAVKVNEKQFSRVYGLAQDCYRILDVPVERQPEIYVSQNPIYNAFCYGVDKPFIVLNSSLVKNFDDDELLCVFAHEMGHALSGHSLYRQMLLIMTEIAKFFYLIPAIGWFSWALYYALMEWSRKAELSADRAGLLVVQDVQACIRVEMKLMGGTETDQMNLEELLAQADEFDNNSDLRNNIYKFLLLIDRSHPFGTVRIKELLKWSTSGEYEAILKGSYPTDRTDYYQDVKDATRGYADDVKQSTKPLGDIFSDVTDKAQDFFKNLFGGGGDDDKDGGKRA